MTRIKIFTAILLAAICLSASAQTSSSATTEEKIDALQKQLDELKAANDALTSTVVANQAATNAAIDSPSVIHYKGIEITPIGFLAAETVNRSKSTNSDINTPFNKIPFQNAGEAYTSEFEGSGRQSRLGLIVTSNMDWGKATGYYEADFLGVGTSSNDNQSNSYVFRQREVWAQAAMKSGFTFTTGQMWSMVTELKKGIDEASGAENLPQTIDSQYHVGFSWTRQWGARFTQSFNNNKEFIGFSLEEPAFTSTSGTNTPPDVFIGGLGQNSGLYNLTTTYSNNLSPDMVIKFAADPGFGHWEAGAVVRFFRGRIYPNQVSVTPNPTGAYNSTVVGGGYFANARFNATKKINLGIHIMGGDGVNRYGTSQLTDLTFHTNGSLEPLRGLQGLFSIETHPTKKLDIFGYAGAEYAQRTYYVGPIGGPTGTVGTVGYGPQAAGGNAACNVEASPSAPAAGSSGAVFGGTAAFDSAGSCGAVTRYIAEGTAGFTYRFFNSPTKGRLQYSMVYSYLTKTAWVGSDGVAPIASNNMIFTGFRYYIP